MLSKAFVFGYLFFLFVLLVSRRDPKRIKTLIEAAQLKKPRRRGM